MEKKMAKLTIDDLKKIKEKTSHDTSLRNGKSSVKITVHMGTCGIAAGAREVMRSLMSELEETHKKDIRVLASGCLGMCSSEPNVTIEIKDEKPVVYQKIDANKMRQIFKRHVLEGEVQTAFALSRG